MNTLISKIKIAAVLCGISGFSVLALAGEMKDTGTDQNKIEIKDFAFNPQTITVKSGEKITWINRDEEPHTVVSVEKQFKKSPALDTDQDQIIGGDEIPESISVSFTLGGTTGVPVDRPGGFPTYGPRVPTSGGPEWFTRMDRNGDGDVTLKEFLGSEADFARLDTSGDGLLDPQEARAAAK